MAQLRGLSLPLLLLVTLALVAWPQRSLAVDVGESEASTGSCPNVTTVSVYSANGNATSASNSSSSSASAVRITVASTCRSSVVKVGTNSAGLLTLDLRNREIESVASLPAVNSVRLENNQLRAFATDNSISKLYLMNNSISALGAFAFPASLAYLDLTNNALGTINDAAFSSTLQYLNLSGNPMGSLVNVSFPSSLTQLDMVDASIASLQNLSFPSAITKLNFSSNPITMIRGVIFPESLTALTLLSTSSSNVAATASTTSVLTPEEVRSLREDAALPTAQSASLLEEFEVRQSDADMFEKLQLWDVSTTSTLECSDPNANPRYVDNTMLCVLSDAEFAAKYHSVVEAASSGSTGSIWGTMDTSASQAVERVVLKETLHQRRSWFLIVAGALLVALTVLLCLNAFCMYLRRQVRGGSSKNRNQFVVVNPTSSGATRFWPEREKKPQDEEVLHLLSSDTLVSGDESSLRPEIEQEAKDKQLSAKTTPLGYLQQHLHQFEIAAPSLKNKTVLSAGSDLGGTNDDVNGGSGASASLFVYSKAVYHRKPVVLKTLYCKQTERESEVSVELWSFVEEIRLSSMLSHPHIVAFYGYAAIPYFTQHKALPHGEDVALVMEFMAKGDLNAFIQMHKRSLRRKQAALRRRPRRANTRERMQSLVKRVSWHDDASAELMEEVDEHEHEQEQEQEQLQPPQGSSTTASNAIKWSWQHSSAVYKSKLSIAIEVAQAVHYLHSFSPPLFHGNLSSRKVFLDSHWNVKLGDLTCCSALRRWSSSRKQSDATPALMAEEGSPLRISGSSRSTGDDEIHLDMTVWTAPEVLDGRQYTEKADIYSFGILLAQLDSYDCSSAEHSVMDDTEVPMLRSDRPGIQSGDGEAPTLVRLLTLKCQAFQPEVRPTADELLQELHHIALDMTENSSTCTTPVASSRA